MTLAEVITSTEALRAAPVRGAANGERMEKGQGVHNTQYNHHHGWKGLYSNCIIHTGMNFNFSCVSSVSVRSLED